MESGTFHPKVTRHAWWRRALWALPGVFVFCCYTLTSYPIVRHLLVPWVRASRTTGLVVGATYASLLVAVLYCWLRLALGVAEPGWVPDAWLRRAAKGQISRRDYTYCHKCEAPRPLRAHHCGTAGRCVLAFDHRCPWTSCTVGWGNKPVFLQFLFWTTLFTGFCTWLSVYKTLVLGPVTMTGRFFPPCFRDKSYFSCFQEWAYDVQVQGTVLEELSIFLVFVLALAFTVGTVVLGVYHLQLAMRGSNTFEDGMSPNEFDLGSRRKNLEALFGPSLLRGFFSPVPQSPGDGTLFTRPHLLKED